MSRRTVEARQGQGERTWKASLPAHLKGTKVQKGLFVQASMYKRPNVIEPPDNVALLVSMLDMSPALRPAIDAYAVNIDQFGHTFIAMLDLARDDILDIVTESMLEERRMEAELVSIETGEPPEDPELPTDAEAEARIAQVTKEMERERQQLEYWLKAVCPDMTFIELRKATRVDLELTGNAYWEVRRNKLNQPARIEHIPVGSIAAMVRDTEDTEVEVRLHRTPITISTEVQERRFRRYVQQGRQGNDPVFFKEHGDPRVMSSKTGTYYPTLAALNTTEPKVAEATEVHHFKIRTPKSEVYGAPRWGGCALGLAGARDAEEVNYHYFRNKSVPPMALLVSGATVSKETIDEIKDTIENDLHGVKNFHRVLVVQAETAQGTTSSGNTKIELKPLAQVTEGQFMHYVEKQAAMLVGSFRLPQLYRGEISSFNRATAQVAVEVTEQQVFYPEREAFDSIINRFFLRDLGIRYWSFKSLGPPTANADERATIVAEGAKNGIPTLNEARALWGLLVGRELERIDDPRADLPLPVALEALRAEYAPKLALQAPSITSPDDKPKDDPTSSTAGPAKSPRQPPKPTRHADSAPRATRKRGRTLPDAS